MGQILVIAAFGAVIGLHLWSLFDKRIAQWMRSGSLGIAFVADSFLWDGWLRWMLLAVGVANLAAGVYRYVRPEQARRLP